MMELIVYVAIISKKVGNRSDVQTVPKLKLFKSSELSSIESAEKADKQFFKVNQKCKIKNILISKCFSCIRNIPNKLMFLAIIITFAPNFAQLIATCNPMPADPPVTITFLFFNDFFGFLSNANKTMI